MKIVLNNIIPPKGFVAINLFGVLFFRKDAEITDEVLRHEAIHTAQMKELFYVGFYWMYLCFWIINLFRYRFDRMAAYRNICFEREAYAYSAETDYLSFRQKFAWIDL